jgi:hypothetical protein
VLFRLASSWLIELELDEDELLELEVRLLLISCR